MNILFSVNEEGIKRVEEALFSFRHYNENLNIFIINDSISKKKKKELETFVQDNNIGKIEWLELNMKEFFPLHIEHTTKETYYKLFAPFLLPDNINRILYVDYDVICTNNIKGFYERDFCGKAIIGIYDFYLSRQYQNYINAGVLLIDCNKYREITSIDTILNYIVSHEQELEYQEQDVLNYLLKDHILCLWEKTYNYQINVSYPEEDYASIIHYSTSSKPWKKDYKDPQKALPYYKNLYYMNQQDRAKQLSQTHFINQFHQRFNLKKIRFKETLDIIMPSYNATKTIRDTLDSIVNQKLGKIKVTVYLIDDASEEDYSEIVKEYQEKLNLKYYRMEKNSGVALARQRGIDEGEGDYFTIIDSDDHFISPYSVLALYCAMQESKADVVRSIFLEEFNWGYKTYKLYRNDNIACHGKLYSRKFLKEHNIRYLDMRGNEDTAYNALVKACGATYYDLDMMTYFWSDNKESFTRKDEFYHEKDLITFAKGFVWTTEEIIKRKDTIPNIANEIAELLHRIYLRINHCWQLETQNEMYDSASKIYFMYRKTTNCSLSKIFKNSYQITDERFFYFTFLSRLENTMFQMEEYKKLTEEEKKKIGELYIKNNSSKGKIIKGKNVQIGECFTLEGDADVIIGDNTIIEDHVTVLTNRHIYSSKLRKYVYQSEVYIGNNVLIGSHTIIKAGIHIGDNTFIEEGSVVLQDIKENSIANGNPCEVRYNIDEFDHTFYDEDKKINWKGLKEEE